VTNPIDRSRPEIVTGRPLAIPDEPASVDQVDDETPGDHPRSESTRVVAALDRLASSLALMQRTLDQLVVDLETDRDKYTTGTGA
jgi:hypothetical protein